MGKGPRSIDRSRPFVSSFKRGKGSELTSAHANMDNWLQLSLPQIEVQREEEEEKEKTERRGRSKVKG